MPKNDLMNTCQNKILKELHEVNTETTDTCVHLETGEVPLKLFAQRLCIKNWTCIKKGLDNTPLTVLSQWLQNKNHHWPELIKGEPFSIGLGGLYTLVETTKTNIHDAYLRRKLDLSKCFFLNLTVAVNLEYQESGFRVYLNKIHPPLKLATRGWKIASSIS